VSAQRIRVLVADPSAFVRKAIREMLSANENIEVVGTAHDGLDVLEQIEIFAPDVVTLDLALPTIDTLGVIASLPRTNPPQIVVVSTSGDDSEAVVAALQAGAVGAVQKPTALAGERLYEMSADLVSAVLRASVARALRMPSTAPPPITMERLSPVRTSLVVIGASAGGPQALTRLIAALPASFPVPIALVLHMPVGSTEAFAKRMDEGSALEVLEASDGMELRPGRVIVARAGVHLMVELREGAKIVKLDPLPERPYRPSVDVLFASAALALGAGVLGVVLTGMGEDGLLGSREIVAAGGRVITQSETSCVVYGMPRRVAEAGLSDESADLDRIPEAIARRL
jgi:two-component system chemotaxis response regulator CheB